MRRWQEDQHAMRRQSKIWVGSLHDVGEYSSKFDKPLGKFRKRRAHGCKPRCRLCHADKLDGRKTHQEMKKIIGTKEQIAEL
jgi:hypothetical protein